MGIVAAEEAPYSIRIDDCTALGTSCPVCILNCDAAQRTGLELWSGVTVVAVQVHHGSK